ncbi:MAG: zinc ribbon domain-containing protein [Chloroflexota bacterium]
MQKVEVLFRLQQVDLVLDDIAHQLQEVEAQLGESPELLAAREAQEGGAAARLSAEAELREREFQVARTEAKLKEVNASLYSGKTRPTKELSGLQKEAEVLAQQKSRAEDLVLALFDEVERLQAEAHRLDEAREAAETLWREQQQTLRGRRDALLAEQAQRQAAREALAKIADPAQLPIYQALRKQKGGRAVVKVEQSLCGGCRIGMAMQQIQRARTNPALTFCASCGRIVYIPH